VRSEEQQADVAQVELDRNIPVSVDAFVLPEPRRPISSIVGVKKGFEGDNSFEVTETTKSTPRLTSLVGEVSEGQLVIGQVLVGSAFKKGEVAGSVSNGLVIGQVGPQQDCEVCCEVEPHASIGPMVVGPQVTSSLDLIVGDIAGGCGGLVRRQAPVILGQSMSENLDILLQGQIPHLNGQQKATVEGVVGNISSQPDSSYVDIRSGSKSRKHVPKLQSLPFITAPKWLRFAGSMQASHRNGKNKRASSLDEGVIWSAGKITRGKKKLPRRVDGEVSSKSWEASPDGSSKSSSPAAEGEPNNNHFCLGSTAPLHDHATPGENRLLNDDSLKDVEGFAAAKRNSEFILDEASKILEIQQGLGLNFTNCETDPLNLLVEMEYRDQKKAMENEVAEQDQ
jgi:hypothetical protein